MDNNFQQQPPMVPSPGISFQDAIRSGFENYCNFNGRATRAEYWWWILFTFIVGAIFSVLGQVASFFSIIGGLVNLALLLPSLGLCWRRMHDIGKGGGWFFISLIPLVGWIIWIVWCCKPSEPVANRFGAVPPTAY